MALAIWRAGEAKYQIISLSGHPGQDTTDSLPPQMKINPPNVHYEAGIEPYNRGQ